MDKFKGKAPETEKTGSKQKSHLDRKRSHAHRKESSSRKKGLAIHRELFDENKVPADSRKIIENFEEIVANVRNLSGKQKVSLYATIKNLSHQLTDDRNSRRLGYMNEASSISAYISYFMWWNLVRMTRLFSNLPKTAFEPLANSQNPVAIDIGSGTLTVVISLWLARPELRNKKIKWYCMDLSQTALAAGEDLYFSIAAKTIKGEVSPSAPMPEAFTPTPSAGAKKAPATPPKTPEPARPAQTKQSQPAKKTPAAKQAQPKQSQPAKQVTSKTTEQPKMAEQTLQKSIDELMAEQQQKKTTKKAFDWSQFDEMEGNTSSSNSTASAKNNALSSAQNAFSGSAASSAQGSSGAKSESKSNSKSAENQSVSSSTKNALSQAVSAHKYSSSTSNVSSTVTADTSNSNGHVSIKMSDGVPRILLEPAEPKIVLSAEAASLIDSTKQLTISFTVTAGGTVPVANIKISPDILPSIVSMEIKEQISRWRFQSAPSDGQAQFSYTIKKK